MILWAALTLMVALMAVGLTLPLARRAEAAAARGSTAQLLREQLAGVDAQVAAGAVSAADAEALRTEIKRRLLAEAREEPATGRALTDGTRARLAFGVVGVVAVAAVGLYAAIGRPAAESAAPGRPVIASAEPPPGSEDAALVAQMEARMAAQPADPEGWRLLGGYYVSVGRFADGAAAFGRAAALAPDRAELWSSQGEALARAAEGRVTPEASDAFRRALALDAADPQARYFLALEKDQGGDPDGALADWIAMLNGAPAGAPWAAELRTFVEGVARQRGVDLAGRLRPAAVAAPGPGAADLAAAEAMTPAERQAMVAGMVERLESRLAAEPLDAAGWERLVRARVVLGQPEQAQAALAAGLRALEGRPAEQAALRAAAGAAGAPAG